MTTLHEAIIGAITDCHSFDGHITEEGSSLIAYMESLRSALAQQEAQSCTSTGVCVRSGLYVPAPQAQQPMTDKQILNLVGGMQDCLCDPYDADGNGDYYSSIPKDMIRLARAVERYHDIGAKQ